MNSIVESIKNNIEKFNNDYTNINKNNINKELLFFINTIKPIFKKS